MEAASRRLAEVEVASRRSTEWSRIRVPPLGSPSSWEKQKPVRRRFHFDLPALAGEGNTEPKKDEGIA